MADEITLHRFKCDRCGDEGMTARMSMDRTKEFYSAAFCRSCIAAAHAAFGENGECS